MIIDYNVYKHNTTLTYPYYDTKFSTTLKECGLPVYDEHTKEFENDYDVINFLYTSEICHIFGVENVEDICKCIDNIYNIMITSADVKEVLNKLMNCKSCIGMYSQEDDTEQTYKKLFPVLFSYDMLFFTHNCINDICLTGSIQPEHMKQWINAIETFL